MATAPTSPEPAAAAPAAPAPSAPSIPSADDLAAEVSNVLGFGPAVSEEAPSNEPPAAPQAPVQTPTTPAQVPPTAPSPSAPAATPSPLPGLEQPTTPQPAPTPQPQAPVPGVDANALELASLRAQVQALTQALDQRTPTPAAGQPEAPADELVKPEEVSYGLKIPDQVLGAVFNEDPNVAAGGMHHLINSLASIIHKNVLTATRKDLQGFRTELTQSATMDQQEVARQKAQDEYYTSFPTHNHPHIKLIVAAEAQKLGAEFPHAPWDDNFKNALGARVNNALAAFGAAPPAQPTTPAAPTTPALDPTRPVQPRPAAPASFLPTAPSPGGIPAFEQDQDLIASTFSFG